MHVIIFLIGIMLLPAPLRAGAWLREEGTGFVSVQTNVRRDALGTATEIDTYGDYGLTSKMSVGFSAFSSGRRSGNAALFLRFPLGSPNNASKWSLETGVGAYWGPTTRNGLAKVTISYGRNIIWKEANGWLSVESTFEKRFGISEPIFKLDATVGQSGTDRPTALKIRPMIKLNTTYISGQPLIWSLSTNLLIDGKNHVTWLVGLERKQLRESNVALIFGLWRQF